MRIERNNMKVEVNKPEVHFDEDAFTQVEKKQAKKAKILLVATVVVATVAGMLSNIRKVRKKLNKNKK